MASLKELLKPLAEDGTALTREQAADVLTEILSGNVPDVEIAALLAVLATRSGRDRDRRAAFALYDTTANEVRFYRVPYDIAGAQQRILAAGLPQMLAARLAEGR